MVETEVTTPDAAAQETWMETDTQNQQDGPKTIPAVAHLRIKEKLTTRVADRDEEISKLRQEIEALKSRPAPAVPQTPEPAAPSLNRPRRSDFEDEEAYYEAVDRYQDKALEDRFSRIEAQRTQNRTMQSQQKTIESAVDSHYQRVGKLLEDSGVSEDVYLTSHQNLENVISMATGGDGKQILNQFISSLGEGSEKSIVYVGRNSGALNEFRSLLADDPSGLKAAAFLGMQTSRLNKPGKATSTAPSPAPELPGGDQTAGSIDSYVKRYRTASKKGDINAALNAKLDAKAAGVDTSDW